MTVLAIIVAAGKGVRMGASRPKALLRLGGLTLLERSIGAFLSHPRVDRVVAAVPDPDEAARILGPLSGKILLVRGGETRQDSVRAGLQALPKGQDEIILVHDAARPLVSREIIDSVIAAAASRGAAVPAIAPDYTIKQIGPGGALEATLPRDRLRLAQTPQGFRAKVLREAYARAAREGFLGTDDSSLVERTGQEVWPVEGSQTNIKITTPLDMTLAEAILGRATEGGRVRKPRSRDASAPQARDAGSGSTARRGPAGAPRPLMRLGCGADAHPLRPGRRLVLGGVEIPHPRGLAGHSDADVLSHAVCDALLGALGLEDMGARFPDSDASLRGRSSLWFLTDVMRDIRSRGFDIVNVDTVILAEAPRLRPHLPAMRIALAAALGVPTDCVCVKAKRLEGLGAVGRQEGIMAQAVVLLAGRV